MSYREATQDREVEQAEKQEALMHTYVEGGKTDRHAHTPEQGETETDIEGRKRMGERLKNRAEKDIHGMGGERGRE